MQRREDALHGPPRRRAGGQGLSPRVVRPWTTFFGAKGWINVNRRALYASDKALQKVQVKPEEKHLTEAASQARDFVDCIKNRKPPSVRWNRPFRSDTISHLSDLCIRLGRPLQWTHHKGTDRRRRRAAGS